MRRLRCRNNAGRVAVLRDGLHLGEVVVLCMLCVLLAVFLHLLRRALLDGIELLLLLLLLLLPLLMLMVVVVVVHLHLLHVLLLLLQQLLLLLLLVLRLHAFVLCICMQQMDVSNPASHTLDFASPVRGKKPSPHWYVNLHS